MRGAVTTGLLLFVLISGCWSRPPAQPPSLGAPATPGSAVPPWVPPLTPAQTALLAPVNRPIRIPAARVFPDLDRFGYAQNRVLASAEDAVKFTRMVTQVLHDSPRFFTLDEAPADVANTVAQYGPRAAEPDGFAVVRRDERGLGQLVPAPSADEARAVVAHGERLAAGGDLAGALASYRAAVQKIPSVPALRVVLASALREAGKLPEAELACREALAVDPSYAPVHIELAELAERRGDLPAARRALVEALAYHPGDARALAFAERIGVGGFGGRPGPADGGWLDAPSRASSVRVPTFSILLDVDSVGAVHVGTAKSDAAQIYGGCRAAMRYEPDVRAKVFQQPRETPYYLSVVEEVVCTEAGLGAYLAAKGGGAPADPGLDELYRIASEEGLSGYVMFEILGRHRPERARAAPEEVHRDIAGYIERHVLGGRQEAPRGGVYAAAR